MGINDVSLEIKTCTGTYPRGMDVDTGYWTLLLFEKSAYIGPVHTLPDVTLKHSHDSEDPF